MKKIFITTLIINFLILISNYSFTQTPHFEIEWDRTFYTMDSVSGTQGCETHEYEYTSIIQTYDSSYIAIGTPDLEYNSDISIIKINKNGEEIFTKIWLNIFNTAEENHQNIQDYLPPTIITHGITQSSDNGCVFIASIYPNLPMFGAEKSWLIKIDKNANIIWKKALDYGNGAKITANSIIQTSDDGYIIAGEVRSEMYIQGDLYVIKIDSNGNKWDEAMCIIQTTDGGFAIAGYTTKGNDDSDFWILKLDQNGNKIWGKIFGDSGVAVANSIIQTSDGGYAVAGYIEINNNKNDIRILKLDKNGNKTWKKIFRDSGKNEYPNSIIQTADNGYAIVGYGFDDILKLDKNGNKMWDKDLLFNEIYYYEVFYITVTSNNNYVIAGTSGNYSSRKLHITKFKQSTIPEIISNGKNSIDLVNSKFIKWQQQGEFEKDIDYNKRMQN